MDTPTSYKGVRIPDSLARFWDTPVGYWWRRGVDACHATSPVQVEPGQIYADNDYRKTGRTLRIDEITPDGTRAVCTILSNYDEVQEALDAGGPPWVVDRIGERTRIKVRRFYPNARGYRLISPAPQEAS